MICKYCHEDKSTEDFKPRNKSRCRSCHVVWDREWRAQGGAEWHRNYDLQRKYGMTLEEYSQRLTDQDARCAACGVGGALVVDHDHATGEVRSLLCSGCNLALGHVADDPQRLHLLASYVEAFIPQRIR